ncbi:unnamed protein product [Dibothriocephalus latus]|uniref:Reverse transcriptase domain-containing protein n=1 Tax=Dibothriocephalus latus TaxID=60516 RepID=A0A3P7KWH5_DIBLA|nr:unnamed protein product [Dibothriocephalus latus]
MSSPVEPLLPKIFLGKLEKFQLGDQIHELKYYGCYVDDIFAIASAAHVSIKFTLEVKKAASLPFLDVFRSRRPDGSVQRSVYQKKAWP